eukprot:5434835-Amphidinium_carterae.2
MYVMKIARTVSESLRLELGQLCSHPSLSQEPKDFQKSVLSLYLGNAFLIASLKANADPCPAVAHHCF